MTTTTELNYWKAAEPYVKLYGNESERERYEAGVLPPPALDAVVSRGVWADFSNKPQVHVRHRFEHGDIEKLAVLRGKAEPGSKVTFETIEGVDELSEEQWAKLKHLRKLAPADAKEALFYSAAYCGEFTLKRAYVRFKVDVGGREFKIELSLD